MNAMNMVKVDNQEIRTRFFWLSNFCDHKIVKNNENEHLWSSNSQKDVIFLQEV